MTKNNKASNQKSDADQNQVGQQPPIAHHPKSTKFRRWVVLALLLLILGPYLYSRIQAPGRRIQLFNNLDNADVEHTIGDDLSIVSYNIAHGRGTASSNWDEGGAPKRERIAAIAQELKTIDADIVVLNEVDFNSTWSGGQNQAEAIAIAAGYQYRVEQRNLDFGFIYGSCQFGNAILSHYPIVDAQQIDFPAERAWEDWLVGCKRGALATVQLASGKTIRVGAVHLEHRSESVRAAGADRLLKLDEDEGGRLILAGDFNSTPRGFPHSRQPSDASNALDLIFESNAFHCLPESAPQASDYTFSTVEPKSVIDWIMVSRQSNLEQASPFTQYRVMDTTLSDHRLLNATIKLD